MKKALIFLVLIAFCFVPILDKPNAPPTDGVLTIELVSPAQARPPACRLEQGFQLTLCMRCENGGGNWLTGQNQCVED